MTEAPPVSDLDLFDDQVLVDPYPSYAALRALGGVVRLPANDVYALTRYDVIRNALGDWETFSSAGAIGFNPMVNEALTGTSLASDPPAHTHLRAALTANPVAAGAARAQGRHRGQGRRARRTTGGQGVVRGHRRAGPRPSP